MPGSVNLNARVRFEARALVSESGGDVLGDWQEQFTRFASVQPLTGGEEVRGQRLQGLQPVTIMVRYDSQTKAIDPSMRAVELKDSAVFKVYAIKTVEDVERDRAYVTILAISGAADA
jgi:head-tail adaptor